MRNEPVPGDLYKFSDPANQPATLRVNDQEVPIKLDHGYVALDRSWKPGDVIDLNLPMLVRRVVANENVLADRGRVALQRGPIVYCAEWPDNPDGKVRNLLLPDDQPLTAGFDPALLNGVEVIEGRAYGVAFSQSGKLFKQLQDFKAIPYFAWANRGRGEMAVWIANSEDTLRTP